MNLRLRIGFTFSAVAVLGYFALANFIPQSSRVESPVLPVGLLRLGLDLQGGIHWVLGAKLEVAEEQELNAFRNAVEDSLEDGDLSFESVSVDDGRLLVVTAVPEQADGVRQWARDTQALAVDTDDGIRLGFTLLPEVVAGVRERGMDQVLEVLRRHELERDAVITAFDGEQLSRCRALGFGGRLGLLVGSKSMKPRKRAFEFWPLGELARSGASDLVIHHKLAHRLLKIGLRRRGYGLALWFSIEDEQESSEVRAAMYQRCALHGAWGAVVGRVSEARVAIAGG